LALRDVSAIWRRCKNARKDVLDAKVCWLAKPLVGDRIVRVRAELSE
jgi:hypothetical protein